MVTTRTRRSWSLPLLAFALGGALPALGATVYKTVDAAGKVSYSDTPPAQGAAVEVIETRDSDASPDPDAAARLEQMRETTDRLRADRLAREQARALAPTPAYPEYPQEESSRSDDGSGWLVPYYPPYRRWHDDGHRPPPPPYVRPGPPPLPPPHVRPEPPPDTDAHSPRGLRERLRAAR
jgi:hypothetical protein